MKTRVKIFDKKNRDFSEKSEGDTTFFIEESQNLFSFQKDCIDFMIGDIGGYIFVFNSISPIGKKNMAFQIHKHKTENGEYKIFMRKRVSQLTEGKK